MTYPARSHVTKTFEQLLKLLPVNERTKPQALLVAGGVQEFRNDTDREIIFRQESNFYYLTGCNVPSSLVLAVYQAGTSLEQSPAFDLFIPKAELADIMWSVPPPSLEEAREKYDVTRIDHPASLPGVLETVLKAYPDALFHTLPKDHPHFPKLPSQYTDLVLSAEGQHGAVTDAYLLAALHHARLTKDAAEIEEIRRANAISSRSHEVVMRVLGQAVQGKIKRDAAAGIERPLLPAEWLIETEGEAEAIFVASCRREGSIHQAYPPIVAASSRASTLHYCCNDKAFAWGPIKPHDHLNRQQLSDASTKDFVPQVLLIDAGCEWNNYASDITRTMPIGNGGKFTPEAKAIYELVLEMQKVSFDALKPGFHWDGIQHICHSTLVRGFQRLGIFKKPNDPDSGSWNSEEAILASGVSSAFFPHGVGHSLGLDVHDVPSASKPSVNATIPSLSPGDASYYSYLRLRLPLEAGMVVTVEPGIYFSPHLLAPVRDSKHINHEVLARYESVGGIRIEDVVHITETGYKNLTTVRSDVEWVESTEQRTPASTDLMTTYRGYPLFNVAEPQTKGIVRARASHLSLCVEPLVAQRSILFRIQTELGEKEGYNQLSAESDYSSLQLISAQPDPSLSLSSKPDAQRHSEDEDGDDEHPPSSCLLSAASVYSQDSWQQNPVPAIPSSSPSPSSTPEPEPVRELEVEPLAKVRQHQEPQQPTESPVVAPPPTRESQIRARPTVPSQGSDEHRRYAMALSPSMDWERGAIASPSLVPLDLATRFIVDIKLLKKDSAGHKSVVVQSFVPPSSNAKANNTSSKVFPTAGPSSNSPTTPTTADPFRAGGDAGGSFFLFQPDPPDQISKKLRKKSTHVHTRTLSESHTSSSSKSSSSASLRRALSRLTFAAAAPSRDRADLPPALRRTKSQLVSPPPLTPAANAQLPALRFSPIHLKLQLPTIHSAVTPSTSDPSKRADSPLVLMTPGPAVASSTDGGVKKDSLKEGVSITPPLPPLPPATAAAPPPPPTPLHRRATLKKAAPDTGRRTDPPQLPPIPSAPLVPADELIKVNERPPPPSALPPLPPLASLPTLLPLFPSPPNFPSLSQQQHPHHSQQPPHPPPTRDRTVASVAPAPAASVAAVLKRAPPPRLPLVSQAPQIQPRRVHRRYASSPAVLNFRAKDLRIPQQPGTPPPPLPDLKERLVELDRMGMQRNVNGASVLMGGV